MQQLLEYIVRKTSFNTFMYDSHKKDNM